MLMRTDFRSSIGYCYTVLTISILPPIVLSVRYPWDKYQETNKPICNSPECVQMSEDLILSMRQSVDPCEDFYEYVCGNWQMHRELETYSGYLDLETLLQYSAYKKLKSKLETLIKPDEDQEMARAKLLFQQCMQLPHLERVDESVLREHMKKYGFWSVTSKKKRIVEPWLDVHNYYLSISGESPFFRIDLHMPKDAEKPQIRLQRIRSPYGAVYHKYQWEEDDRRYYFTFLEKAFLAVASSEENAFSLESLHDDLRDVLHFRHSLQKLTVSKVDPSIPMVMKISELTRWYSEKGCAENTLAHIDWLELFRLLLQNNKGMTITENTMVYVYSLDYFNGLCNLLLHTRRRTIVNHTHLYFIERHITLKPNLKKLLYFAITRGLTSTGKIRYIQQQWYSCIENHSMQGFLGLFYTKTYITPSTIKEVHNIIRNLKDVLELQIKDVKWISAGAKKGTVEKSNEMKFVIGYPSADDRSIDKNVIAKMIETSAVPYAFYNIQENVIYVSSFYLQLPIYDPNLPFTVTYATLGSLIAHEMYHLFDEHTINSGVLHSIWEKKDAKHHKDNVECFADYYKRQPIKELQYKTYEKARLNVRLTRNENVADVMGLKSAYNAYKKVVWGKKGMCPTLPRFESVSCDKLFFIAYATTFCSVIPGEMFVRRLSEGKHSPNRLRVNVPVSSMKEFSRAFNCKRDSSMNPAEKCDLWT